MENTLGIICEYNPFHNGHLYQIKKAKEISNAKYVIAVMSGNFTQRGNTSIVNKWEKAKIAIQNEVDLVIELPTIYSISSAENFADGAVKILNQIGVKYISFGMECSTIDDLKSIADILSEEPQDFKSILKEELKNGTSYPKARELALEKYLNNEKYIEILKEPNNILAIEYLKALKMCNSNIIPVGIKREKVGYNSESTFENFASSTAIRRMIKDNEFDSIKDVVPNSSFEILMKNIKKGTDVSDINKFENIIIYKLRNMSLEEIRTIPYVSEGLENSIKEAASKSNNLEEIIQMVKSKRYTQTRIQRIMTCALLGITKVDMEESKNILPYVRVLGYSEKGKILLEKINENSEMITSVKKFESINENKIYSRMLEIDKRATDIYTIGYDKNSLSHLDYTMPIVNKNNI